jgi:hypothetical protein
MPVGLPLRPHCNSENGQNRGHRNEQRKRRSANSTAERLSPLICYCADTFSVIVSGGAVIAFAPPVVPLMVTV